MPEIVKGRSPGMGSTAEGSPLTHLYVAGSFACCVTRLSTIWLRKAAIIGFAYFPRPGWLVVTTFNSGSVTGTSAFGSLLFGSAVVDNQTPRLAALLVTAGAFPSAAVAVKVRSADTGPASKVAVHVPGVDGTKLQGRAV